MDIKATKPVKRHRIRNTILWILGILILIIGLVSLYFYNNFNRLLSDALKKSFNSGIISDVYEFSFEKLGVNLLTGNIQVYNVELKPREKPLKDYPYINSSLRLSAKKILLSKVDIQTLLKTNMLKLERIDIIDPNIDVKISNMKVVLFPFRDSSDLAGKSDTSRKKFIDSYLLKEFALSNATMHLDNQATHRELNIRQFNITLKDMVIVQAPKMDIITNKSLEIKMGEIDWKLQEGPIQRLQMKDYNILMDSLKIQNNPDTSIYQFTKFTTGLKSLDIQTADSLFQMSMSSFNLSYKDQSITLKGISFKPNISDAAMQRRFVYQTPVFAGTVGTIKLVGLNFDSLIFKNKILIDELILDKLSVSIDKDQRKPIDKSKFPKYLAQQIGSLKLPLLVKHIKATNVNLVNIEKKPDGTTGKVNINRMTIDASNLTSLPTSDELSVSADAWIENKAHAKLTLKFSYAVQQFSINGRVDKFNLPDLNKFLKSYTPASIVRGTTDEMTFSANVGHTSSIGKMKFLYHDLKADIDLKDQAKWKSDILSFAGNTIVASSNPVSPDKPAKEVQFTVERDMNKGFINIMIKSVLAGFKETMMMSKENRKTYKEAKKDSKKKAKEEKKARNKN